MCYCCVAVAVRNCGKGGSLGERREGEGANKCTPSLLNAPLKIIVQPTLSRASWPEVESPDYLGIHLIFKPRKGLVACFPQIDSTEITQLNPSMTQKPSTSEDRKELFLPWLANLIVTNSSFGNLKSPGSVRLSVFLLDLHSHSSNTSWGDIS